MLKIKEMRVEDLKTDIVTDSPNPSISCILESNLQNVVVKQTQYKVYLDEKLVWDSGIKEDGETINIRYEGVQLLPFTVYLVKAWVKDSCGETAAGEIQFETGRMNTEWKAQWITDASYHFFVFSPKPMVFRKSFKLPQTIKSAKIYSTAFGIYELC
uniref:CAZy families GH78 protein n=1 Tax=uncultured Dictyoglomus sp. TaxID=221213 RepID=A0A060C0P2_9BACT|nr:CAZy families GH78 protein [uncultured Dictyoglomus sp.]